MRRRELLTSVFQWIKKFQYPKGYKNFNPTCRFFPPKIAKNSPNMRRCKLLTPVFQVIKKF
jgi:hypothetical protein